MNLWGGATTALEGKFVFEKISNQWPQLCTSELQQEEQTQGQLKA